MTLTFDPINGVMLLAIGWLLYERRKTPAKSAQSASGATPTSEPILQRSHFHEILRKNEEGEYTNQNTPTTIQASLPNVTGAPVGLPLLGCQ